MLKAEYKAMSSACREESRRMSWKGQAAWTEWFRKQPAIYRKTLNTEPMPVSVAVWLYKRGIKPRIAA